jgi:hypothetical protein
MDVWARREEETRSAAAANVLIALSWEGASVEKQISPLRFAPVEMTKLNYLA